MCRSGPLLRGRVRGARAGGPARPRALALVEMRSRQNPRRHWSWLWPIGFTLIAVNWMWPIAWSLALVYLHPLVALCFLDRELGRRNPRMQRTYRYCLTAVPVLIGLSIWRLASAPSLPGTDILTQQITHHAGSRILTNVSSHLLVSLHTFIEMLHYAVWLLAIPLISLAAKPWRLSDSPLAKKSWRWRYALTAVLVMGAIAVLGFWAGFIADYPMTRDVYFTVALIHVLVEVPFLLRAL